MLLFCAVSWAQETPKHPISLSLNYYFGGLVGRFNSYHTSLFLPYQPRAIELTINKIPTGRKAWEKHYNYPIVGLSLAYYDYQSTDPLGNLGKTFAITPFFEQYLIRRKIWSFSVSPGLGLGYHTEVYNSETNYKNNAISTHLTAAFIGDFKLKFHISTYISVQATYTFRHFSNGAVHLPNPGTNFMLWGAGLTWNLKGYKPPKWEKDSIITFDKKIHINIEIGANKKGIQKGDIYKYGIYSAGFYISRRVSRINSLLIGLDAYYDESVKDQYKIYNDNPSFTNKLDTTRANSFSLIANIGTEVFIGNFSYTAAFGWHLYQSDNLNGNFVHRHTLKYYFFDHFYLKGALKVYSFAADSFDVGLGVRI
jgi:hypothetical protein